MHLQAINGGHTLPDDVSTASPAKIRVPGLKKTVTSVDIPTQIPIQQAMNGPHADSTPAIIHSLEDL